MAKNKELRDLSVEELELKCTEARRERFNLKNQSRKDQKLHLIPEKKKEIARLMTIIHEKRLAQREN